MRTIRVQIDAGARRCDGCYLYDNDPCTCVVFGDVEYESWNVPLRHPDCLAAEVDDACPDTERAL